MQLIVKVCFVLLLIFFDTSFCNSPILKADFFQRILDRCGRWSFNAFTLENVAGGRSLPVLCVHLFHWYGLLDHFRLDVVRIWKLFSTYSTLIINLLRFYTVYTNIMVAHLTNVICVFFCSAYWRRVSQQQPLSQLHSCDWRNPGNALFLAGRKGYLFFRIKHKHTFNFVLTYTVMLFFSFSILVIA